MKLQFPDYTNCIANLANSILEEFGIGEGRQRLEQLDQYLKKDYQNIVIILLDGMGKCIIDKNLEKEGFFNSHLKGIYSSVFPPTTVAATASAANGLVPCEHAWLGGIVIIPRLIKMLLFF